MFILTLTLALYFVPALLAGSRNHPRTTALTLTNLCLGWTLVGWVACLVWALSEPALPGPAAYMPPFAILANTAYPAGRSAASMQDEAPHCRACGRPTLPTAIFCTMCGANLALRS